jgi:hypothetical protein
MENVLEYLEAVVGRESERDGDETAIAIAVAP